MFFSIIIPLYNRPQEIDELLHTLTQQTYTQFEVLVIEDGSKLDAREIVESYTDKLDIKYFVKENEGQGFSRNYGFASSVILFGSLLRSSPFVKETMWNEVVALASKYADPNDPSQLEFISLVEQAKLMYYSKKKKKK